MPNFIVKKVAVLLAPSVIGAQIAAHCVNAKVPVVLFDLPAKEDSKNGIVLKRSRASGSILHRSALQGRCSADSGG